MYKTWNRPCSTPRTLPRVSRRQRVPREEMTFWRPEEQLLNDSKKSRTPRSFSALFSVMKRETKHLSKEIGLSGGPHAAPLAWPVSRARSPCDNDVTGVLRVEVITLNLQWKLSDDVQPQLL